MYDFAKELFIDEMTIGNKSTRDKSPLRVLKSPGVMISASGFTSSYKKKSFSKTRFSSSVANELCDKLKVLLQEKQAGNNSDPFYEKFITISDKLLQKKRISTKQHKFSLINCLN